MAVSATYLQLQQVIADELGDRTDLLQPLNDSGLSLSPIQNAIQSAIALWEDEPFWFNETYDLTAFYTAPFQEYYPLIGGISGTPVQVVTGGGQILTGGGQELTIGGQPIQPSVSGQPVTGSGQQLTGAGQSLIAGTQTQPAVADGLTGSGQPLTGSGQPLTGGTTSPGFSAGGQTLTGAGQTLTGGGQPLTGGTTSPVISAGGQPLTGGGQVLTGGGQVLTGGTSTPSSTPLPVYTSIYRVRILVNNNRYTLNPRTWQYLEDISVNPQVVTSIPVDYAIFANQMRLYPIPNGVYPLTLTADKRFAPLINPGDSNIWTTEGYDLIRTQAKLILAQEVLHDPDLAAECKASLYGDLQLRQSRSYVYKLKAASTRRTAKGKIRASYFLWPFLASLSLLYSGLWCGMC